MVAEGRRGTRVAPRPALRRAGAPGRAEPDTPTGDVRDLAVGLPDPELLPPLGPALARIDLERKLEISRLEEIDDALLDLARTAFADDGAPSGEPAIVGGAFDGIERVLQAHLRPGDRVIVEDPAYTATRDLLLALGLIAVPVAVDDRGLIPDRLEAALAKGVDAAVIGRVEGAWLDDQGIAASGRSGLNVWIPVREEGPVVRALLEEGWFVLAGERFRIATPPGIRITIATLDSGDAQELARVIAAVEHAGRPRRAYR
ncbi:MAG: hypothetical protein ACXVQR_06385 [Solirubrobacteraceae bacterium]